MLVNVLILLRWIVATNFISRLKKQWGSDYDRYISTYDVEQEFKTVTLAKLQGHIESKINEISESGAIEAMQKASDEWFKDFTSRNFEELMKEKLKNESQMVLQREFSALSNNGESHDPYRIR